MPPYEIIEPVFQDYILGNAQLKQLATGFDWVEGPVWFGDAGCLLFSDIPNDTIHRWTPNAGLSTYRAPSHFANGHTRDRAGRLVSCEHGTRRVTRTEYDGTITVLADRYQGKRLNSPNDVVVKSDGSVWFTDPHYGIVSNYEGHQAEEELPCNVYRIDPITATIEAVLTDFDCPNGLAFSPDETVLYVADTGRKFDRPRTQHIRAFAVAPDGTLSGGAVFHKIAPGAADGFRVDTDGNLWSSAADGVHCLSPAGVPLGKILVPELVSNLCFGGRGKHVMFITATTSVYSIALIRAGV
ncbi:SMP-30/gluconolactonase/LRE family protein [Puniceibacterium sp. IMCC21224]|uniref:SMP-30/gluconolactonase/LRE family protein n=1 Tax=Puniceibacterium sp. IMCC21224 TaxID=1618204 RepID=UPI00064D8B59|nr:SMP-30/gluconolactonase/LRE family protein [Puniceibacterium sp. IMCC21224]KMK68268.1 gluconolactonase [Puniceibacterium sp. IMCC21224]